MRVDNADKVHTADSPKNKIIVLLLHAGEFKFVSAFILKLFRGLFSAELEQLKTHQTYVLWFCVLVLRENLTIHLAFTMNLKSPELSFSYRTKRFGFQACVWGHVFEMVLLKTTDIKVADKTS